MFVAQISPDSPRYKDWRKIFEGDSVPLVSGALHLVTFPTYLEMKGPQEAYRVDVSRLEEIERERLFRETDASLDDLAHNDIYVLAKDLTVTSIGNVLL